jgi:hypothetical protein
MKVITIFFSMIKCDITLNLTLTLTPIADCLGSFCDYRMNLTLTLTLIIVTANDLDIRFITTFFSMMKCDLIYVTIIVTNASVSTMITIIPSQHLYRLFTSFISTLHFHIIIRFRLRVIVIIRVIVRFKDRVGLRVRVRVRDTQFILSSQYIILTYPDQQCTTLTLTIVQP